MSSPFELSVVIVLCFRRWSLLVKLGKILQVYQNRTPQEGQAQASSLLPVLELPTVSATALLVEFLCLLCLWHLQHLLHLSQVPANCSSICTVSFLSGSHPLVLVDESMVRRASVQSNWQLVFGRFLTTQARQRDCLLTLKNVTGERLIQRQLSLCSGKSLMSQQILLTLYCVSSRIEGKRLWLRGFNSPSIIISHSPACFAIEVIGSKHLLLIAKQQLAYSSQNSGKRGRYFSLLVKGKGLTQSCQCV